MKKIKIINGTALKGMAMAMMLCDHIRATGICNSQWLTAIGRMAFPIFAFEIAEGYANTKNYSAYVQRIFIFALISEIPFNLMVGGTVWYPLNQNVLFSFLLSLLILREIDCVWKKQPKPFQKLIWLAGFAFLGYLVGLVMLVDYYGFGILMVILFWITREKPWGWAAQLVGMWYINWKMMDSNSYVFEIMNCEIWIPQQGIAVLALAPIWMYNGKRGPGGTKFQYFGYAFYPLHIVLLLIAAHIMAGGM